MLAKWLPESINSGSLHPLLLPDLSHFTTQAFAQDGALVVTVSAPVGRHQQGKPLAGRTMPLVTFGVATRSLQGAQLWASMAQAFDCKPDLQQPDTPYCAVAIHPSIAIYNGSVEWLGDFDRCLAWAWITRNPDLRPAT